MMRATFPAVAVALATLSVSLGASASASFPAEVAANVPGLTCVPQCTLCHFQNPGMVPAGKPFALALKAQGLMIAQPATVGPALAKLKALVPPPDSDADGVSDYAELEAGTDPNDPTGILCSVAPTYGCGATIAAKPQTRTGLDVTATMAAAFTLLTGLLLARRAKSAKH